MDESLLPWAQAPEPPPWRPSALARRRRWPELMDDPGLPEPLHHEALAGLARLNAASGLARSLWPSIRREVAAAGRPLTILEPACGGGEVLAGLVARARGRLRGLGEDISPVAVRRARARFAALPIRWRVADALATEAPRADIVFCSLFLHHLDAPDVVALLRQLDARARRLVLVSDLERGWLAWWGVWLAARVLTRSPVVHVDSGLSVRAAWTRRELDQLARRAGINAPLPRVSFPARQLLAWRPAP